MRTLGLLATLLLLPACATSSKKGVEGANCKASADCEGSLQCMDSVCRPPRELAGSELPPTQENEPRAEDPSTDELKANLAETQREVESLRRELLQAKEGSGNLSVFECRAFSDKIVELTVKGQTGAAADMARDMITAMRPEMEKECLEKGTRAEIECALRANSLDDLEGCDASSKKSTGGRPSERSCRAFADKVVELTVQGQEGAAADMARDMITAMKPEMMKECQEKGSQGEIDCALKAKSLDDLERCDASRPPAGPLSARPGGPSVASCNAFSDKVVELTVQGQEGEAAIMARSMIEAMKPEMTKECLEKGSQSEVACALRAKSLDDLERCGGA